MQKLNFVIGRVFLAHLCEIFECAPLTAVCHTVGWASKKGEEAYLTYP